MSWNTNEMEQNRYQLFQPDFTEIKGQEHVKRGLEVALVGCHSVVLIGPPNSGKTVLRQAAYAMFPYSIQPTIQEMHPCPCGHFTNPYQQCHCTPTEIMDYLQEWACNHALPTVHIEVPFLDHIHLSERRRGESTSEIKEKIVQARMIWSKNLALDKEAEELLKLAILELGISPNAYDKIKSVSDSIAALDGKQIIEAHHISEAIGYRSLDRNLWG